MNTHWTTAQTKRLRQCIRNGDTIAFCNTDAHGGPANGGQLVHGRAIAGLIQKITGEFKPCTEKALHATLLPELWAGSRVWFVSMRGTVQILDEVKIAATEREFIGEIFPEEAIFHPGIAVRLGCKNLRGANLSGANLCGADLRRADLGGAFLDGADLRRADLRGADLGGAYLGGADLGGADLGGAYLRGADLGGAFLDGADLRGADLRGADLRGADLRGADLGVYERGPDGFAKRKE